MNTTTTINKASESKSTTATRSEHDLDPFSVVLNGWHWPTRWPTERAAWDSAGPTPTGGYVAPDWTTSNAPTMSKAVNDRSSACVGTLVRPIKMSSESKIDARPAAFFPSRVNKTSPGAGLRLGGPPEGHKRPPHG